MQCERLASETSRERDARLRSARECFHLCRELSRFAHHPPSVCSVRETNIYQNSTPSPTTWIPAPYHLNFRYMYYFACKYNYSCMHMHRVSSIFMHTHGGVGDVYIPNMHHTHLHVQVLLHICISTQLQV